MKIDQQIKAFSKLGEVLLMLSSKMESSVIQAGTETSEFNEVFTRARHKNPWFTRENILFALQSWGQLLSEDKLEQWIGPYKSFLNEERPAKTIGVVNAGNIPFVGFHDLLCVLLSGHSYMGKNASEDPYLLPLLARLLTDIEPSFKTRISFVPQLKGFDAVIATGSNNSARYFEHYFGKVPHIIRKNRNGVAVLSGEESALDLYNLGEDIFRYFGLGCRNVSKLYVPANYDFKYFFESIYDHHQVMQHNKFLNNFEYNNAVFLLKGLPFLQNGFLIVKEDDSIASPIAVVHYERYTDFEELTALLLRDREKLQCIVTSSDTLHASRELSPLVIGFGMTQHPALSDYADGVDTLQFLLQL